MSLSAATRPYDIVVWGATGFTGRLVCEHIARDYQGKVRWAMAGRDARKLEEVKSKLAQINPACKDVPILTADARDASAVGGVLKQTSVVLAMAGPFSKYGNNVVAQSVEQGTHYCDITGEVHWVKQNAQRYHAAAEAKGVRVIHCCGYDSVPSDLGALMMVDHARTKHNKGVSQLYTLVREGSGGVSGGTIASAGEVMAQNTLSELQAMGGDQYYLASVHGHRGSDRPAPSRPFFVKEANTWTMPFIMEGVNARIVQLSAALVKGGARAGTTTPEPAGDTSTASTTGTTPATSPTAAALTAYGADFRYCEAVAASGPVVASLASAGMGLLGLALLAPPMRGILSRLVPPGSGPSESARLSGHWRHELVAITEGPQPLVLHGQCGDRRDPGYWSTSRMILEAGLCMVLDANKLSALAAAGQTQGSLGVRAGGVLTPASALGMVMVDRLRAAGFTWAVEETKTSKQSM